MLPRGLRDLSIITVGKTGDGYTEGRYCLI